VNSKTAHVVPDWLDSLSTIDFESGGRPELSKAQLADARDWLATILVDVADGLVPHIRQLERYYKASFSAPISRCLIPGCNPTWSVPDFHFRHRQRLNDQQMTALAVVGIEALRNGVLFPDGETVELAKLLLNPYALFDLSDLITYSVPFVWQDRFAESGKRLVSQLNLRIPGEETK
jgi:hypothetical protein